MKITGIDIRGSLNRVLGDHSLPVSYVLGRFAIVRRGYSAYKRLSQIRKRAAGSSNDPTTLFPGVSVAVALQELTDTAVFQGLRLPARIADDIEAYARRARLSTPGVPHVQFFYSDVQCGCLPTGQMTTRGVVEEPMNCVAVRQVSQDPVLNQIVTCYLRYRPDHCKVLLYWSFATNLDSGTRRHQDQTFQYHFDVDAYNFVYGNFYLTDTDRFSGAHVMIKGSHAKKPLRMLFGSARRSDATVLDHFGQQNEVVIEGPKGFGFVQDPSCFHKALPPVARDRLMLQMRFS